MGFVDFQYTGAVQTFTAPKNGTYILEDEGDNKCYDYHKDGYYLDMDEQLFKKCFETCNKCNKGGNITNNNCLECKPNYIAYNNSIGIMNCYEICDKYFYIDEFEIYNWSNKGWRVNLWCYRYVRRANGHNS